MSTEAHSSARSVSGGLEENTNSIANASVTTARPVSEAPASPRVSTVGTDEHSHSKKEHPVFQQEVAQEFRDYSAPGLDSLHWAGVKKRGDFDQRSVASSMNAERDDQSIYEQPGIGAVEEAVEHGDEEEEVPEEIVLTDLTRAPDNAPTLLGDQQSSTEDRELVQSNPRGHEARVAASSHAASTEADAASIRPTSEDGDLEDVALGEVVNPQEGARRHLTPVGPVPIPRGESVDGMHPPPGSSAAPSSATSPRSLGLPQSPISRASADFEAVHELASNAKAPQPQVYQSALLKRVTGATIEAGEGDVKGEKDSNVETKEELSAVETNPNALTAAQTEKAAAGAGIQPFQMEGEPQLPPSSGAQEPAAAGSVPLPVSRPETVNGQSAATLTPTRPPVVSLGPEWENTFKGLLYMDSIDALGRPVVVLNADAVPHGMRSSAVTYVKGHLEPVVNAGDYVLVFTARKAKLPSLWIMGAYQSLPRPYRKNVQYVVLVRPTGFLKAILAFMRPFVSRKAGRKIKTVESLEEIGVATGGEVTLHHLSRRFLDDDAAVAAALATASS